jgi:hypothetical protein
MRRTLHRAAYLKMTLKSGAPCVKATSRSSTARPQEKNEIKSVDGVTVKSQCPLWLFFMAASCSELAAP